MAAETDTEHAAERTDFIREMIRRDLAEGRVAQVVTRFPPEPNGYLHIGHAKAILLGHGVATEFGGRFHLRFDDTNPETEEEEYVRAIIRDVKWLGADFGEHLYYASDYFERFYAFAVELVEQRLAYVDDQSEAEIRETRGTVTEPGRPSPWRDRPVAENLDLLERMRKGEFESGARVLRAKIDMAAANMKMRDPLLYRIRNVPHYRAGDGWHIYPMYDFAHPLEDAIEGVTHSLCTLEFENNREVYDWILEHVSVPEPRPRQTEFARGNLTYTVMSKRKLLSLVKSGRVEGWDDPRMPTLAGMRRRGYTPAAIRAFWDEVGISKANTTVEVERLEHAVREDLNRRAPRMMAVLRPLELVVEDLPEVETEWIDAPLWPHDVPGEGTRRLPLTRTLYIERDDFAVSPPKGFKRLSPGVTVRLRHAAVVRCTAVEEDAAGEVVRVRAVRDPEGKPKGTIHWVSAAHATGVAVRLYDRLFSDPHPEVHEGRTYEDFLNPDSLETLAAKAEPALSEIALGTHVQLERQGYFFADPVDGEAGRLVLNRTVPLKDPWARKARADSEAASETRPSKKEGGTAAPKAPPPLDPEATRLVETHGLDAGQARTLAARPELRAFFETALAAYPEPKAVARWVVNDLAALAKAGGLEALPIAPKDLADLAHLADEKAITGTAAKDVLIEMARTGESPAEIVARLGLDRAADEGTVEAAVDAVIEAHPDEVARYRAGKKGLLGFFVGKVMAATGGKADPAAVRSAVAARLDG